MLWYEIVDELDAKDANVSPVADEICVKKTVTFAMHLGKIGCIVAVHVGDSVSTCFVPGMTINTIHGKYYLAPITEYNAPVDSDS